MKAEQAAREWYQKEGRVAWEAFAGADAPCWNRSRFAFLAGARWRQERDAELCESAETACAAINESWDNGRSVCAAAIRGDSDE